MPPIPQASNGDAQSVAENVIITREDAALKCLAEILVEAFLKQRKYGHGY